VSEYVIEAIDRLRSVGAQLDPGLSETELATLENELDFTFGPEHRELLSLALPLGGPWVNWRNAPAEKLRGRLDWPVDSVIFDVHHDGFWPVSWGKRPLGEEAAERVARAHLALVPQLVPVFAHRYLASDAEYAPSPVFSVYQTDVIMYGDNLLDYVSHEFEAGPRHPTNATHVPFWSDLVFGAESPDL
jgi:hypothetical protein